MITKYHMILLHALYCCTWKMVIRFYRQFIIFTKHPFSNLLTPPVDKTPEYPSVQRGKDKSNFWYFRFVRTLKLNYWENWRLRSNEITWFEFWRPFYITGIRVSQFWNSAAETLCMLENQRALKFKPRNFIFQSLQFTQ